MATRVSDRLSIDTGHPLYPVVALIATLGLLLGRANSQPIDDLPDADTHVYFPDHWWPYPVMAVAAMVTLGVLAYVARPDLAAGQPASIGTSGAGYPDWYFLFLHELLKLGPPAVTTILLPLAGVVVLLAWPLVDSLVGPLLARRLGWSTWPVPGRNLITATVWLASLAVVSLLTLWGLAGSTLCVPWFYQGPVCG
jgi:quinol-cytochrome oxidoreductase complex cytochrome b subunit